MKECTTCKVEKPLEFFSKQQKAPDGHTYVCKTCAGIAYKNYLKRRGPRKAPRYSAKISATYTTWYKRIRAAALEKLGGKCIKCGFDDSRALQIDHINGGGAKELRRIGAQGIALKILRMTNPEMEYQLLCANHNWIKKCENREIPHTWLDQSKSKG